MYYNEVSWLIIKIFLMKTEIQRFLSGSLFIYASLNDALKRCSWLIHQNAPKCFVCFNGYNFMCGVYIYFTRHCYEFKTHNEIHEWFVKCHLKCYLKVKTNFIILYDQNEKYKLYRSDDYVSFTVILFIIFLRVKFHEYSFLF